MAFLDVTDVLLDPDFVSPFAVVRSAIGLATTTGSAETTLTPTVLTGMVGSIQPATSRDLERMPDAEALSGTLVIYTTFALTAGDSANTADVVVVGGMLGQDSNGNPTVTGGTRYTVRALDQWAFGQGYCKGFVEQVPFR